MKEVIFKDHTSELSRKKDIVLTEHFEKDGMAGRTDRRCFYFIKDIIPLKDDEDLEAWLDARKKSDIVGKRHFFIYKKHDEGSGEDKIICKISGTFYALVGRFVYTIAFLHSFKVRFVRKLSLAN